MKHVSLTVIVGAGCLIACSALAAESTAKISPPVVVAVQAAAGTSTNTAFVAKKVALKFVKADSEEKDGEDGKGANAVDGNPETIWHTQWQDASPDYPHEIIIELDPPCAIKGFTYLPRQDESDHGMIKDYEFYISDDGKEFSKPVKKGTFAEGRQKKTIEFDSVQCRFIKLKALSEINGDAWASAAEIGIVPAE